MEVRQQFPFVACEKCKSIRPYTNENIWYSGEEVAGIELIIGCEHEQECRVLRDTILHDALAKDLEIKEYMVPVIKVPGRNVACHYYECPACGEEIVFEQKYCSGCGKPIKWD